jgi:hypothetical protein
MGGRKEQSNTAYSVLPSFSIISNEGKPGSCVSGIEAHDLEKAGNSVIRTLGEEDMNERITVALAGIEGGKIVTTGQLQFSLLILIMVISLSH